MKTKENTIEENREASLQGTRQDFTSGPIAGPLVRFALPVLLALVLQALYGAVDLWVVGKFASSADVSAVSTGSQLTSMIANVTASLCMGCTILLGIQIGQGRGEDGGITIGASIYLFGIIGLAVSVAVACLASPLARLLQAPEEAFAGTVAYLRICGGGTVVIAAYNILGSIFRGIGDSKTPLVTVAIACAFNIAGDLLNVAVFHMGAAGAAVATVFAQAISVLISVRIIRRQPLPFLFTRSMVRSNPPVMRRVFSLGFPLGLSDFLVGVSFLVILAIVNSLGLIASAGVGVAEKVCAFIMLVPSSFMQSLASVVSQNYGAKKYDRCRKALRSAISLSFTFGVVMFYFNYFHGILAASVFSQDPAVLYAAAEYLRAYAIDCLFTAFLFCFIGYFNGIGMTRFVMIQGLIGAFAVRIPVSILMRNLYPESLFRIALATPCSSVVQILLCLFAMLYARRKVLTVPSETL